MTGNGTPKNPRPKHERAILGGAGLTLVGSVIGGVLVFGGEVAAARLLGVAAYGLFGLAFALARVGETFTLCGLRIGLLHYIPIHRHAGRKDLVRSTIVASLLVPSVVGLTLAGLTWLAAPWLGQRFFGKPEVIPFLRAISLAIPVLGLSEILGNVMRAFGRPGAYVVIRNLVPPLAFLLLLGLLGLTGARPATVAVAVIAAYALAVLVGGWMVRRLSSPLSLRELDGAATRALYRYAFPILINTLLYMVIVRTDILMLGVFRDAAEVGIYRGCLQIVVVFDMVVQAFNAAAAHIFPVLLASGKRDELQPTYRLANRWIAMASTLIFLCVLLGGPLVLPLLGPDFSRGATALAVLAAGGLIKGCFGNAGFVLVVGGRQTVETANAVFGAVANVLLNLLWIPSWGLLGAAVATTTVAVIMATLRAVEVDRLIGLSIDLPSLARPILLGVACGAMGLLAAESLRRVGVGGWAGALLPAVAMVIGYPALLWRFGLEAGEKRTIGNWIRRRFANAPVA